MKEFSYLNKTKIFELFCFTGVNPSFLDKAMKNIIGATIATLDHSGYNNLNINYFMIEKYIDLNEKDPPKNKKSNDVCKVFVTHSPKIDSEFIQNTILFVMLYFATNLCQEGIE